MTYYNFKGKCTRAVRYFIWRFLHEDYTYKAAALTFNTLLALVPLLFVSFTIFSAFPVFNNIRLQVQQMIIANLAASSGEVVQHYLNNFVQQASRLSISGLLFLFITALMMIYTIVTSINAIWRVKHRHNGLIAFLIYWSLLTITPIVIGIAVIMCNYIFSLSFFTIASHNIILHDFIINFASFFASVLILTLLYVVIPNCHVPLKNGFLGAMFSSVLILIAHYSFVLYVANVHSYQAIYGALAVLPLFLLWLYCVWLIVLIGALLSHVLTMQFSSDNNCHANNFMIAYYWLGHLWQAQQQGLTINLRDLIKLESPSYLVIPEEIIRTLEEVNLVKIIDHYYIILARDFHNFSLAQLYNLLPWKLPHCQLTEHQTSAWDENIRHFMTNINVVIQEQGAKPLAEIYSS